MINIKDILGNKSVSVFDIETMRYGRREQMYSAAVRTGKNFQEIFFDLPQKFFTDTNYRSRQYLKRSGYASAAKTANYSDVIGRSKSLSSMLSNTGDVLVGHNLQFDLSHTARAMTSSDYSSLLSSIGAQRKKGLRNIPGIADAVAPRNVRSLINNRRGALAYSQYALHLEQQLGAGKKAVADTLTLSQILLSAATERKDLGLDFSQDVFSGLKMGFISNFFEKNKIYSHTGSGDTAATEKYFNWLTEKALPQVIDQSTIPDKEVIGFLDYVKNIQDSGWSNIQKRSKIAGLALDYASRENLGYEARGKFFNLTGEVASEQVYGLLGGDKFGMSFENFDQEWESNLGEIGRLREKYKTSWKYRAEKMQYEKYFAEESRFLEQQGEKLFASHPRNVQGFFRSGADQIRSRNKYLIGAASLVGGLALINQLRVSGKDDDYNTIEGLRHGGVAEANRKEMTDFGSGYRGSVSPIHHPEISPDYNEAEDVYRYEMFRASKIGASEEELYKWATRPDKEMSPYVQASSTAGTALHQLMQAQQLKKGEIAGAEKFTYSQNIGGHIDVYGPRGIGDIKTVDEGIYNTILREGKPKPMHKAQVMFYLGSEGEEQGYIQYVNRQKPWQHKTFFFQFNAYQYEQLVRKTQRVRQRVEAEVEAGKLIKSSLPKTASLERLIEDGQSHSSPAEEIARIPEYQQIFAEEMAYLSTVKRGMPTTGPARERIERKKREHMMSSAQGIGLELFNSRNAHHVM